jgi:glucose 1-dehydrogenase/3-oxoacyl-[acyl-carrier protein] reductase
VRLEGKKALVTGANRGIGRALAIAMAKEGADVVINYIEDPDAAAKVCEELEGAGGQALAIQGDISVRADVERLFDRAFAELGPLDILINNAGIETIIDLLDLTDEQWSRVTDVNLRGTWMCSQAFARRMIKAGRGGAIVNLGSIQAGMALPGRTHYAPTKRGVEALTANLAAELAQHRIRVNCVHPGVIETDMTRWVMQDPDMLAEVVGKIPMQRVGQPEEIAGITVLLASEDAAYITGQHIYVDGGMRLV